jgi:glutamate dehydrogenase (NADP+)
VTTTEQTGPAAREIEAFMERIVAKNPAQPEFHQAVREVVESVMPLVLERPAYRKGGILERLTEPDRIISFRVSWVDDHGDVQVNRAHRVQFSNAIGPYKGGLRFHPTVNISVLKFLGFEQIFKNSLTGLPMGGAKGGADFDPKGRSDGEIMRFCQAMMIELYRYIGEDVDVPAGDIGVGSREIGFLFGHYRRIRNRVAGVITGKGLSYGGSLIRTEATGYGAVYFVENMLNYRGDTLQDKTCVVSGSGNVAIYTAEKVMQMGGRVVTLSDSEGFIYDKDGITPEKLAWVKGLKEVRRGRIREYAEHFGCDFHSGVVPWVVPCQVAFPSATQNELEADAARTLVRGGCIAVGEGANMPCTPDAARVFVSAGVSFGPGKAVNAGGVAVSGLEQTQNALRLHWGRDEVDQKLRVIMKNIHDKCVEYGLAKDDRVNYVVGANRAGFVKVADALLALGV